MFIQHLSLAGFKNYDSAKIELSDHINCFVGPNGAGKTNLLDAVHYLCLCKSYFNPIDSQNIGHAASAFKLKGKFGDKDVACTVARSKKKVMEWNGKRYDKLAAHIGKLPVVVIAPDDLTLVSGGSTERRRMMDHALVQTQPGYLSDLSSYQKALKQRNATLKQFAETGNSNMELLASWDEQLIASGTAIHAARKQFIADLMPHFEQYYKEISGNQELPGLEYESDLLDTDLGSLLLNARQRDLILRRTTTGPHKDEIKFLLNDHVVKRFGSQGQRKSFLIAIKLAIYHLMRENQDGKPILLLDDIFDKLDRDRITNLMRVITGDGFGQIILTDTNEARIDELFGSLELEVEKHLIDSGNIS
jgi:DNA replication and repair protein RecF